MNITELCNRKQKIKEQIIHLRKNSKKFKELIAERQEINAQLAELRDNPLFSKVNENDFQFDYRATNTDTVTFEIYNPDVLVLPHTKPRVFDGDIEHISIDLTEDNLPIVLENIYEWQGIPIFLRTNVAVPTELIHGIAFSPYSCIIYNANVIPHSEIKKELITVTACALSAQLRMFCDNQSDLSKALFLLQETAGINRFPWKLYLSEGMAGYKHILEKMALFFRCGIDIEILSQRLDDTV